MKYMFITCLAALGLGGCTSNEGNGFGSKAEPGADRLEAAKVQTRGAVEAAGDYTYARKDEFVANMKAEMAEIRADMDRLGESAADKADLDARMATLRAQWERARVQLDRAENAGESAWEDVKAGFMDTHQGLKGSVRDARQWLSDAIEP